MVRSEDNHSASRSHLILTCFLLRHAPLGQLLHLVLVCWGRSSTISHCALELSPREGRGEGKGTVQSWHIHTYTHVTQLLTQHTYVCTYMRTHTQYRQPCTHVTKHTYMCTYIQTHTHTHTHARTHMHMHAHTLWWPTQGIISPLHSYPGDNVVQTTCPPGIVTRVTSHWGLRPPERNRTRHCLFNLIHSKA